MGGSYFALEREWGIEGGGCNDILILRMDEDDECGGEREGDSENEDWPQPPFLV